MIAKIAGIRFHLLVVMVLCAPAVGCAGLKMPQPLISDISPQKKQRHQETLKEFERRRFEAQFQTAVSRWQQGDLETCQAMLQKLLQSNGDHLEARRLLANVCLENEDLAEHERQLRRLLKSYPRDAAAHHALALLLETSDRRQEAGKHFQRAWQLQPNNKLYAMSKLPQTETRLVSEEILVGQGKP